jgi:hypothetical protein
MQVRSSFLCFPPVAVAVAVAVLMPAQAVPTSLTRTPKLVESIGKLPLRFERNQGQLDKRAEFIARGPGYTLFLGDNEAVFTLQGPSRVTGADPVRSAGAEHQSAVMRMQLLGADQAARPVGVEELPGKSNYYVGNDPAKWRTHVPAYGKVKYQGIYPGIDLVYYGNQRQLEYDFVVSPGADPKAIRLAIVETTDSQPTAQTPWNIDGQGDLVARSGEDEVRFHKPVVYQSAADGRRIPVEGQFLLSRTGEVSFDVTKYDHGKPLVIDPTLAYSTFLGGSADEAANGLAVDASGNIYLTGSTTSADFPTVPLQSPAGSGDCFVAKISADGSALDYASYLGGNSVDYCNGIGVDAAGNAYVAGSTYSTDFPVKNAFQSASAGAGDAFVAKINSDGSLGYSTYLGGSLSDSAASIVVDSTGMAYVAGSTESADFPIRFALQSVHGGAGFEIYSPNLDAFVSKIDPSGALVFSTFLGGSNFYSQGDDYALRVALDPAGNIYVGGGTSSSDFPTKNAAQPALANIPTSGGGDYDAFVTKISGDGSTLLYSTYLGGGDTDRARGIAADAAGNAYASGITCSSDFPLKKPLQSALPVCSGFVAKIDTSQSGPASLLFSTLLGGTNDQGYGTSSWDLALDAVNNVYVVGHTSATNFPTTADALQTSLSGPDTAFVAKINPDIPQLLYAGYLGGAATQIAHDVVVSGASVYVSGYTYSTDFPTTPGALQPTLHGSSDAFVVKLAFTPLAVLPLPIRQALFLAGSGSSNFTITSSDGFNQTVTFDVTGRPAGMTVSPTHFALTPPPNGSVSQALSFAVGPSVTPGVYTLRVIEQGTTDFVPITVNVAASTAGAAQVVSRIQAAGCISPAIASALVAELNLAQSFAAAGRTQLAADTYAAMLIETAALQSRRLIASTCLVAGASFSPAVVLTADIHALAANLKTGVKK